MKINCYQTNEANLSKSLCLLVEKCYYNKLKTLILAPNQNLVNILDKGLWTYSKKHFIPHATSSDPLPDKQPIYITEKLKNPNNSEIVIFVNISKDKILEILSTTNNDINIQKFSRIMFIFDEDDGSVIGIKELEDILTKSALSNYDFNHFIQSGSGKWQQETVAA